MIIGWSNTKFGGRHVANPWEQNSMKDNLHVDDRAGEVLNLARTRWLEASARASNLGCELFQPGSGYGDPEARMQDEHKLQSARLEAERLFREYNDLERRTLESKMVMLQRSQRLATWASFAVAATVGAATIVKTVIDLLK